VDLGYEDATAFSLCAYNEYDKKMYVVKTYKQSKMDVTDVAEKTKEFTKDYKIHKYIIDGANKQAVEEIKRRHGIPFEAAEKTGKVDFIEIMNSELIQGNVQVVASGDQGGLCDEWLSLVWDEKSAKREENAACPNHIADATLYAWRYCYGYLSQMFKPKPAPTSEAAIDEFWDQEAERLNSKQAKPFWDRDWDT
jgi:hypothetical protein